VATPSVSLQFVGHATVLIDIGGFRILTDPFVRDRLGPLERHGPVPDVEALGDIDLVVISHGHPDHFDRRSLATLRGRPVVVVPRGLGEAVESATAREVIELSAGDKVDIEGVAIRAVPARHWISPGSPRAHPLGYLIDAGTRIYFAGDTGRTRWMSDLEGAVDVALLPVWTWGPHLGPGHLGPRSAAEVLRDIRPAIAVPIHWGTLYPRRLHRVWRSPLDEPGDRFARQATTIAPDVDVRVLRPGDTTQL
jgi:L-ascorbate metabolism protein UlaG (beta-lactamase superfamily)